MRRIGFLLVASVVLSFAGEARGQLSNAFSSLLYPLSLQSQALGEQGVALSDPGDVMQYNPAALTLPQETSASFFINPWKIISTTFGHGYPLSSYVVAARLRDIGSIGIQLTDREWGPAVQRTAWKPLGGITYDAYERTFAVSFARTVSDELSLGAQLRGAFTAFGPVDYRSTSLFVSAGLLYMPEIFTRRLSFGFSLTNFGLPVKLTGESGSSPPPSQVNLGASGLPVNTRSFDIEMLLGMSKILHKQYGSGPYYAQSSFQALFNDWGNFPDDMTAQAGLGFVWHPLPLGRGVSFIERMYLGYFTTGPKENYASFYTHGVEIGLEVDGITATAGYAGRWHNNNQGSYIAWGFPWETFQLSLKGNMSPFGESTGMDESNTLLDKIVIAGGVSYGSFIGRMKGQRWEFYSGEPGSFPVRSDSWSPRAVFSIAADFYFDPRLALTTSFGYTKIKRVLAMTGSSISNWSVDLSMETLYMTSGLRYHPIAAVRPLFIEGDIGIIRVNPIPNSMPKYSYQGLTDISVGALVPAFTTGLVVTPKIGFRTMYDDVGASGDRLGGYNQILYTLGIGYVL